MNGSVEHTPVLLKEAIDGLAIRANGNYIDGTFGRGGHSSLILQSLDERGSLLAIDKDPAAIATAKAIFADDARFHIEQASFADMKAIVERQQKLGKVDGVLLDLGVSSPQLDDPLRGFSFLHDGPLDMRMNPDTGRSASEWLATANADEIAKVLFEYGEERYARRIARAIIAERDQTAITRTRQLADIVKAANPKWEKHKHPATRAFQAIRIFINDELSDLEHLLTDVLDILAPGGRLVVISFHSLEDRRVKRFMRDQARAKDVPAHIALPETQIKRPLRIIGKAIKADAKAVEDNPRARSAVLRIGEKIS